MSETNIGLRQEGCSRCMDQRRANDLSPNEVRVRGMWSFPQYNLNY